jgi:hypothetical protein
MFTDSWRARRIGGEIMSKYLISMLALAASGCATWGPTWSEITGARYPTGEVHQFRRPAIIEHVDNQGAFANYPIKVEPGIHRIEIGAPVPGWRGGSEIKVMLLDVLPCKRYYINAQFENNVTQNWVPVLDYVEDIAGCKAEAAK